MLSRVAHVQPVATRSSPCRTSLRSRIFRPKGRAHRRGAVTVAKGGTVEPNPFTRLVKETDIRARSDVSYLRQEMCSRAQLDAARVRYYTLGLADMLSAAVSDHWSDGGLSADLEVVDVRMKRRAMEDTFVLTVVVKEAHGASVITPLERLARSAARWRAYLVSRLLQQDRAGAADSLSKELEAVLAQHATTLADEHPAAAGTVVGEKEVGNGERETAATAAELMPEDLGLIVEILVVNQEIDNPEAAQLVQECSKSQDSQLRRALAEALAVAPSLEYLGQVGLAALQRLAGDRDNSVAAVARESLGEYGLSS